MTTGLVKSIGAEVALVPTKLLPYMVCH